MATLIRQRVGIQIMHLHAVIGRIVALCMAQLFLLAVGNDQPLGLHGAMQRIVNRQQPHRAGAAED